MFRPTKLFHARVIIDKSKADALINSLYELGLCEIKKQDSASLKKGAEDEGTEVMLSPQYSYESIKKLDDVQTRFNLIVDSLEPYEEVIQPGNRIKKFFSPEPPKKHKSAIYSPDDLIEEVEYHLSMIEPKVLERLDKLQKIREEVQDKEFMIHNLSLMPDVKTGLFKSSENIKVSRGMISASSLQNIKDELGQKAVICSEERDKGRSFIAVLSTSKDIPPIEKALHSVGFQSLDVPYMDKKPKEVVKTLNSEISGLQEKEKKICSFLAKAQKVYKRRLDIWGEELGIAKQKVSALQDFKATRAFSVLEAWVPEKNLEEFHKAVKGSSRKYYIEVDEKKNAPTLLKNNKFVAPFEMITELYSLPKYGEFDPTPILAVTFTLLFGFMLTDAAYGLLVLVFGWIMYRGIGKFDDTMKKFSIILMAFGISTTLLGAVFGSYFGSFFQQVGISLPVPIDSMKQVMLTLSIALALGSLHLLIGLVAGFYENMHKGSLKDAIAQQGVWIIFMLGLFLFLVKLNTIGIIAIVIAIILQMVFNFMEGGLVSSLLSVFGFSGFMGDLFSYARLMALAIGTAGIALAVNFMVFMVVDLVPWIGVPIAAVVFIVGHLFNVAMNGLGAFIHTTRLHFLEFFTKFYEGGGKKYKPFLSERKNTFIRLEKA
ncbi:V-type ATP synthase subunit I [Candidatus Woesearchaeota archaeon]|nr:V-type ATP synthase subunit I [Candidatus Woesearchaeota archaeon]